MAGNREALFPSTINPKRSTRCRPECLVANGTKHPADDRTDYRHPRVAPVRITFARNRQEEMRQSRTEVARRVNGVARRAAERQTDGPDQHAHEKRSEARVEARVGHEVL